MIKEHNTVLSVKEVRCSKRTRSNVFVSNESNTVALEEFPTINVAMFYPLYYYPEMSALFSN